MASFTQKEKMARLNLALGADAVRGILPF